MASKAQQISKAQKTSKSAKKGVQRRKYRIRTDLRFYKPHTLKVASRPKYSRSTSSLNLPAKIDKSAVLVQPINTEKASKGMTDRNTLTFIVHSRANKVTIKKNFKEIFGIKPRSVNTLNRPDGKKKAFVTLKPEDSAVDVASKLGII